MRKSEVSVRRNGPAANVKVYRQLSSVTLPLDLGQYSDDGQTWQVSTTDPRFTHEWIETALTDERISGWVYITCESNWECLQSEAEEIWPDYGVRVWQDGRSGGWAVVAGLPDVESWDAIALGKWAKFERVARVIADDIPRSTLDNIYANEFEPAVNEADAIAGAR